MAGQERKVGGKKGDGEREREQQQHTVNREMK